MDQYQGCLLTLLWLGAIAAPAFAQITPDNTLGAESSRVTRNATVRGRNADQIDGGAGRGANLFHSFSEFSVNDGQRVYFANPAGVQNILTRVTGNTTSDIMGTLGVDGGASLFLLNPNGIIFGQNARLDVSGSFTASTADRFTFSDGSTFSATNPGNMSLLSVAVPLGVQYGAAPTAISSSGNLTVGQNLWLSGGSVTSTGQLTAPSGQLLVEGVAGNVQVRQATAQTATLFASDTLNLQNSQLQTTGDLSLLAGRVQVRDSLAQPFIANAGGNLTVQGNQNVDIFALNHPSSGLFSGGNMVLRSANPVGGDAHYWTGGSFRIEQLNSRPGDLFSPYDPVIRSAGNVVFGDYSGASLHIFAGGTVKANNITIEGSDGINGFSDPSPLILTDPLDPDGSSGFDRVVAINGRTNPTLDIRAGMTDFSSVGGLIPSTVGAVPAPLTLGSTADGSTISINSITNRLPGGQIFLTNQYESAGSAPGIIRVTGVIPDQGSIQAPNGLGAQSISAYSVNVTIAASGGVQINNGVITGTDGGASGGNTTIYSGGRIDTASLQSQVGTGNGGRVTLRAVEDITTGDILSTSLRNGFGGTIDITSGNGRVQTGTIASTANTNNPSFRNGDINITANRRIETGNLSSRVTGTGFSGAVSLLSTSGRIRTGTIESSTLNTGNPNLRNPDITIEARGGSIRTGDISSFVDTDQLAGGVGNAGNVSLTASGNIRPGTIRSFTGDGNAGSVSVTSRAGNIYLDDITATSNSNNNQFSNAIRINSLQGLVAINGDTLSTSNSGSGVAGNTFIDARDRIRIINSSTISSEGSRGRISIGASSAQPSPETIVLNNSTLGTDNDNIRAIDPRVSRSAGSIRVQATDRIAITNSVISSNTSRRGDSGSITINAGNDLDIQSSFLNSQVRLGGISGGSGFITLNAGSLQLGNGSQINTFLNDSGVITADNPPPRGRAGNVTIDVGNGDFVLTAPPESTGSITGVFSTVGNGALTGAGNARGQGGNIRISSGSLSIAGTGTISDGSGNAGIAAKTFGRGNAGNITILTDSLSITDNGFLDNSTTGRGFITLPNGRQIERSGRAGNISVTADSITLSNENQLRRAIQTSSSEGSGNAGNIDISTNRLRLNRSSLDASTQGGNRGNIAIQGIDGQPVSLVVLRNQSRISAEASGNPNGGNVLINNTDNAGGFILATPDDNDILASAELGNGGSIEIDSFAIFGLEERNPPTPLSDINASSQFSANGVILLNTLNVDPTRGLGELPIDIVNTADLVADGCIGRNRSGVTDQGDFTRTGRGGLSASPSDPLSSETAIDDLATLDSSATPSRSASISDAPKDESLVESQGLALNAEGKVSLVANISETTSPAIERPACIAPQLP